MTKTFDATMRAASGTQSLEESVPLLLELLDAIHKASLVSVKPGGSAASGLREDWTGAYFTVTRGLQVVDWFVGHDADGNLIVDCFGRMG